MKYGDQLKKIRRFLRDPDGNIWDNAYLKTVFNDVQREIQHQTGFLENVEALSLPPFYQYSYMFDWEWRFLPSDQSKFHRCLRFHQQGEYTFCHRWEVHAELGQSGTAEEVGNHFTHPWEAWLTTPGEVVSTAFPEDFFRVKVLAYDFKPLPYVDKRVITRRDNSYQTRSGEPLSYYRDDELENSFVIYPRPSSVDWNEHTDPENPDFVYTYDFESTYISGSGERWLRQSDDYEYVYIWEENIDSQDDYGIRGMFLFEFGIEFVGQFGQVLYVEDETPEPMGTYAYGDLFNQDQGIAITAIDGVNNILCIYDSMAKDIQDETDESDFPVFMRKYIEHGSLQRAYGANTDGRISSLKEYWGFRYSVGVKMMKRFMSLRKADRVYQMRSSVLKPRGNRHPRLPDSYPLC